MRRLIAWLWSLCACLAAPAALANGPDVRAALEDHVLPGYAALAARTEALAALTTTTCTPGDPALEAAYHAAFDAWIRVSHLRFGPSEEAERAFALAFWPDPRGATPKAVVGVLRSADPIVMDPAEFATLSIAARGVYAMEYLLFDDSFGPGADPAHHCAFVHALARDMARNAAEIDAAWRDGYAVLMIDADNATYQTPQEAAKQLFTALATGLEFTSSARLGRPMGSFERPRPTRAEAWRSGRSLRHVVLALESTAELAALLSAEDPDMAHAFAVALDRARVLEDPILAGVALPQGRLRVEVLQQKIDLVRQHLAEELGPRLGIAAGFNSLDGD